MTRPVLPSGAMNSDTESSALVTITIRLHPRTVKALESIAAAQDPPTDRTKLIRQTLEEKVRRASRAA